MALQPAAKCFAHVLRLQAMRLRCACSSTLPGSQCAERDQGQLTWCDAHHAHLRQQGLQARCTADAHSCIALASTQAVLAADCWQVTRSGCACTLNCTALQAHAHLDAGVTHRLVHGCIVVFTAVGRLEV